MILIKWLTLFCISLFCTPSLFADNASSAMTNKSNFKTVIFNDIERPLLRPVQLKKENITEKSQKTTEPSSNPKTAQNIESIMSILSSERKRLQELENEYKVLKRDTMENDVNVKNNETGEKKDIESVSVSPDYSNMQSVGKSGIVDTSSMVKRKSLSKIMIKQDGSSTAQLYTVKDNKKSDAVVNSDVNQRLSKLVGSVSSFDLAECYYKLCEFDNALRAYKLLAPSDVPLDQYIWAQYQIANCSRNMKKYDNAFNEYQRFINQYPDNDLIEQAKWYMDDVNWWKSWYEKNSLNNKQLLAVSNSHESK